LFSLKDASATARDPDVAAAIDAVERYLLADSGPERFRRARGSADAAVDVAAWHGLADVGITSAFVPEAHGGSGFAPGVSALIAERLGWSLAREPFVENVVLPVSLLLECGTPALLQAGEIFCVAWQEGAYALPGTSGMQTRVSAQGGGLRLQGTKRFVMGARASTRMLVLADMDGEPALVCVASGAPGVQRQDKLLADGTCWSDVAFDAAIGDADVIARGAACIAALASALAHANLALAGMLYGLQTRILALTFEYLGTRVQFDKPIGAFQALQHRAVDLYTHAQIARFLIGEAVDAAVAQAPARTVEIYASRAKARTADAALRIAKEGIQMHGGIGFSDEYDLGLYVKRILVLSAWLGSADWHRRHLAAIDPPAEGEMA
jgi:alkylation response protein AidB-like acyl-CoA dehydrogenase